MQKTAIWTLVVLGVVLGACKQEGDAEPAEQGASPKQAEQAQQDDPPGAEQEKPTKVEARGLEAPDSEPAVVELARSVLECEWRSLGFDSKCEALKAWKESELVNKGNNEATLFNLLEDPDPRIRWLAADRLNTPGKWTYAEDEVLSKRIVTAAKSESDTEAAKRIGNLVGRIHTGKVPVGDEIKALIQEHPLQEMKTGILFTVLSIMRPSDEMYDFVADLARNSPDAVVRRRAVGAFWTGTHTARSADTCKLWLELASDSDEAISGEAAYMCSFWGRGCLEQWDALLELVEGKARDGSLQSQQMASSLEYLHGHDKASDAQKQRALGIARSLVENADNGGAARARALRFLGKGDPKVGKLAAALVDDEDASVKRAARAIHDGEG